MKGHGTLFFTKKCFCLYYFSVRERVLSYPLAWIFTGRIASWSQSQQQNLLSIILLIWGQWGWGVDSLSLVSPSSSLSESDGQARLRVPWLCSFMFLRPLPPTAGQRDYGCPSGILTSVILTSLMFGDWYSDLWHTSPSSARGNVAFEVVNKTFTTSIFRYQGKGILEQGQQIEINFRGPFPAMVIFSEWNQISRIFVPSREAFLPSAWIVSADD